MITIKAFVIKCIDNGIFQKQKYISGALYILKLNIKRTHQFQVGCLQGAAQELQNLQYYAYQILIILLMI